MFASLDLPRALRLLLDVARGMAYLHARWVHGGWGGVGWVGGVCMIRLMSAFVLQLLIRSSWRATCLSPALVIRKLQGELHCPLCRQTR